MNNKIITAMIGVIMVLFLTGCGTSQNNNAAQSATKDSMKGMSMGGSQKPLSKAFQDELDGFTTIEQDIKKADFKSAVSLANNLHDEFHAVILPPLKAKKGENDAEAIHGKYDELQDAITNKNNTKITELIKVNRDNLKTAAQVLGVPLK
ncbi:hypothetical protein [Sporolactobacillus putidus]|uniref:Lipoprotein n=1 Tax=Sporolactobacillus putidus TaxID=492735 RepID=A0A917VZ34_9BACL|nr:hypothetical protein [Sporolactobacillus putidus]GGL41526.1 hypothetical protein GCM10007968_01730 [Sporolactobacillus putidus]